MTTKHTPGPWRIATSNPQWIIGPDEKPVAYTITFREKTEDHANARLIAAAPKLLNACEEMISQLEGYERRTGIIQFASAWNNARAAIAKAQGDAQ